MSYLEGTIKQFKYYELLGTQTLERIDEKDLLHIFGKENNNLAMIVKHIAGNMISRFTDFLTSDGEKDWRNRDAEFANDLQSKKEVIELWQKGWTTFYQAVTPLSENDIHQIVYIRNQGHTVQEAINRQLAHYAYHIGQMVFIGKMILQEDWESLSIPLGNSASYNEGKFSKDKAKEHFTDDFLDQ